MCLPCVTVWGDCRDVASSLMTLMHSAAQGDQVGLSSDLQIFEIFMSSVVCSLHYLCRAQNLTCFQSVPGLYVE